MSKKELECKLNNYKMKLNIVEYKLENLDNWIEKYKKKEESCHKVAKSNLIKFNTILSFVLLSSLSHIWLIPITLLSLSTIFLGKAINYSIALKKFKKFNKYLNSKHFNLAFAKFVFIKNQTEIENLLKHEEIQDIIPQNVKEIDSDIYEKTKAEVVDEACL